MSPLETHVKFLLCLFDNVVSDYFKLRVVLQMLLDIVVKIASIENILTNYFLKVAWIAMQTKARRGNQDQSYRQ